MVWTQPLRRALARAMMPKFFEMGYSASAALRTFSDIGPGLRRKLWLRDWREITGAKKLARVYRFIPIKHRLSFDMMAPTWTKQQREFKYIFEATGRNIETGLPEIRTVSFGDDMRMSPEDAANMMAADMAALRKLYKDQYGWMPDQVELVCVYKRQPDVAIWEEAVTEAERRAFLGL